MELLHDYLSNIVVNYCFMGLDQDSEFFSINVESYDIKNSTIYGTEIYHCHVIFQRREYMLACGRHHDWKKRLKFLLLENGLGEPTIYKVLGYDENIANDQVNFSFTAKKQEK